jgi:hypothetical protein
MARSTPVLRPLIWATRSIASCGLSLLATAPGLAAPQPETFPPAESFRNLQLITLTCSRENTAASCEKARTIANPLLDHPRLPTSCKDVLWSINQQARTAESNSMGRRDDLDRAARDLTVFCKPQLKATGKTESKPAMPFGGGNLNFGAPQPAR